MSIDIPSGYGFVLFFVTISAIQLIITGFSGMGVRKKHFTKEFFEKNFPEELKNKEIDLKAGYPDVGSGLYSHKLSHAAWKDINNAQRAHFNFLETFAPIALFMLISGLVYTRLTVILQIAYVIGRFLYTSLYKSKGPNGRLLGALINLTVLAVFMITSLIAAFQLGGGVEGLTGLITGGK